MPTPRVERRTPARVEMPEATEDPVLAKLATVPIDDEPVTDDDRRHIAAGRAAYQAGDVVSAEDIRRACRDAPSDNGRAGANQAAAT